MYPGLPHSKPAKAQNNPEDQTAGWWGLYSAPCSSCSCWVWTGVRGGGQTLKDTNMKGQDKDQDVGWDAPFGPQAQVQKTHMETYTVSETGIQSRPQRRPRGEPLHL